MVLEWLDRFKEAWSELLDCLVGEDVQDRLGCVEATLSEYKEVFIATGAGLVSLMLLLKLLEGGGTREAETREVKIVID